MQDRRSRRDRITAEKHLQPGQLRTRDQAQRDRLRARDRAVQTCRRRHRLHMLLPDLPADFRRLAIGMAGVQRRDVRLGQHRMLGELAVQPIDQRLAIAVEHPQRQTQRPHILAAQRLLVAKAKRLDRQQGQRADIERQQRPLGQAAVLERIGGVLGLFQVALVELARVGDDQAAGLQRADIHLQSRRVHRHQHIRRIARGGDLGAAEVDLERRDAEQGALRCTDLRRKVRERRQIVPRQRRRERELPPGQLHPVARIACKPHHNRFRLPADLRRVQIPCATFGINSRHDRPSVGSPAPEPVTPAFRARFRRHVNRATGARALPWRCHCRSWPAGTSQKICSGT